ncbi:MAG: GNAT family N-acetyltransferase [Paraburkholderia sp.]|jgi:RimJ/RimL family protein N-acetyltransferase|uniref:GNAT family N-acetyltransferase n=1 Tax=Burkholderiaceae TaxID=119060 RepID=UPI0010F7E50A|nr:GNAT family N-acetyltransferase [Burkholderia sp. 4M9327F10]
MNGFFPPRVIEIGEIRLRPFVDADAPDLFHVLLGDPAVTEWLPLATHRSVDESRAFIRLCELGWTSATRFTWALEDSAGRQLLAAIELTPTLPRAELGVIISRRDGHRRRRASLAALLKLIDWLMAQPPLCRLHAYCAPQGGAASTMMRLGFTLEGQLKNWEPRPNRGLLAGDALLFAITRAPGEKLAPLADRLTRKRHDMLRVAA